MKPPECNSISTTEMAQAEITKGGFNGVKLVRELCIAGSQSYGTSSAIPAARHK